MKAALSALRRLIGAGSSCCPSIASHALEPSINVAVTVQPGVTTDEIDRVVHEMIIDNGAYPSPLRYGAPVAAMLDLEPQCSAKLLLRMRSAVFDMLSAAPNVGAATVNHQPPSRIIST